MNSEGTLSLRPIITAGDPVEQSRNSEVHPHPGVPAISDSSDESLLVAVGKGSKDAIGILFERHGRVVLNVAYRILHDESEAADLRQEVFIYLFQRAQLYDPRKSSAISWIMQIAYHRAFNRRRFLTARHHYKTEEFSEQRIKRHASHLSTEQLDGQSILKRFRNQLSREQQQTLELHLFEGYSFQEIANKSGQTVGNVKHFYYRGLEKLRSNLISKKRI
ncbi:RNA polymerase sigma factor [Silvibacterium sp.]|uniref:RNA polymerase sigma factor n=1 Tax=Silvibacterium sp. TaxID=1964179 RepID=UPI0039E53F38